MQKALIKLSIFFSLISMPALQATWDQFPSDISEAGNNASLPEVAISAANETTAVWQLLIGSDYVIQAVVRPLGGTYTFPPSQISLNTGSATNPQVAVNPATGNPTAIWQFTVGANTYIQTSTYLTGVWQPPVNISSTTGTSLFPQIAFDASGNATAVWSNLNGSEYDIQAATTIAGVWQTPVIISPTNTTTTSGSPQIAVDPNGNAVAVWGITTIATGFTNIQAASRTGPGGTWSAPTELTMDGGVAFSPQVVIDDTGTATAAWYRDNGTIEIVEAATKTLTGAWQATQDISSLGVNSTSVSLAVDPSGNVTAVWQSGSGATSTIESSTKLAGGNWQSTPSLVTPAGDFGITPNVTVDPAGNATAVWVNPSDNIVEASTKAFGENWQVTPDMLSLSGDPAATPKVAVGPNGNATAVWQIYNGAFDVIQTSDGTFAPTVTTVSPNQGSPGSTVVITGTNLSYINSVTFGGVPANFTLTSNNTVSVIVPAGAGTVNVVVSGTEGTSTPSGTSVFTYNLVPVTPPAAPTNFVGVGLKNRFLTQTDIIHVLSFSPSPDTTVVGYNLYRNGVLIAQIPATGPLVYEDHNRHKHEIDVYTLAAFNAAGVQSTFVTVTVSSQRLHYFK